MPINPEALTYHKLCERADALWKDISTLAEYRLREFVDDNSHEILLDIARDKEIPWADADIAALAKIGHHLSEVVVNLDALRSQELKQKQDSHSKE